jgi:hypothetical protein
MLKLTVSVVVIAAGPGCDLCHGLSAGGVSFDCYHHMMAINCVQECCHPAIVALAATR